MSSRYAVVMGDIVGSEAVPSRTELHQQFNSVTKAANQQFANSLASPLTITLGDEFQGLTHSLAQAFLIATTMRLRLMLENVKCRFVVGIVDLETKLNQKVAWNMMGPGLATAREKLNEKRSRNAYRFSLGEKDMVLARLFETIGYSMSAAEEDWSPHQLSVVVASIDEKKSAKEIADIRGISERAVYKTLQAAKIVLYAEQSAAILSGLMDLDKRNA
jgi:hypothetical protein